MLNWILKVHGKYSTPLKLKLCQVCVMIQAPDKDQHANLFLTQLNNSFTWKKLSAPMLSLLFVAGFDCGFDTPSWVVTVSQVDMLNFMINVRRNFMQVFLEENIVTCIHFPRWQARVSSPTPYSPGVPPCL